MDSIFLETVVRQPLFALISLKTILFRLKRPDKVPSLSPVSTILTLYRKKHSLKVSIELLLTASLLFLCQCCSLVTTSILSKEPWPTKMIFKAYSRSTAAAMLKPKLRSVQGRDMHSSRPRILNLPDY